MGCDKLNQMTYSSNSNINWNSYLNGIFMTGIMSENRKRSREEDMCEFMPLSKRINNLHINNNLNSNMLSQTEASQPNCIHIENCIPSPSNSSTDSERRPSYDPGLSSSQSKYYYDNKLLFELHLERIQRTGQQFPF